MAFSENLPSFENWTFRQTLADSWFSESFARDTEITLTKALQKSLSNDSETLTTINTDTTTPLNIITTTTNNNNNSPFGFKPELALTGSGSDQDASSSKSRCRNPKSNGGKITKRKSRASKRSPTTFITADPSNFRQMVQQVTGIRFGNPQFPIIPVLKPEPQRPCNRIQNSTLLDNTSTFLMESNNYNNQMGTTRAATQGNISYGHVAEDGGRLGSGGGGGSGIDFSTFQSFPTLESWRVM